MSVRAQFLRAIGKSDSELGLGELERLGAEDVSEMEVLGLCRDIVSALVRVVGNLCVFWSAR